MPSAQRRRALASRQRRNECRDLPRALGVVGSRLPLIGVGGIHSAQTAKAKLDAGATLVQLYSSPVAAGLEASTS